MIIPPHSWCNERVSVLAYRVGRCLLQEKLDNAKLTQSDLANMLEVPRQQVNRYVHDRQRMSIELARNIASILNCQIEDLYEWTEVGRK